MQINVLHQTEVYREVGVFAGWPANHGLWQLGDKVIVGFETGEMTLNGGFHAVDRRSPITPMMAETTDGGESWLPYHPIGPMELTPHRGHLNPTRVEQINVQLIESREPIDFHATLCKFRMTGFSKGNSYLVTSEDGYSWSGPYGLPTFNRDGVAARTCTLTDPEDNSRCLAFWSAAKASDGREGQPLLAETTDGGLTWEFVSWIDEPPPGGFGIMPSALRLPNGDILCSIRWRERGADLYGSVTDPFDAGLICYRSSDEGRTWQLLSMPVRGLPKAGNPPDMVRLSDGRIALVYGWRSKPFAIVVQVSVDDGLNWTEPHIIREGAGNHDLGYSRSFVRDDDAVVSVYYWNDSPESERYIGSTIWEIGRADDMQQ